MLGTLRTKSIYGNMINGEVFYYHIQIGTYPSLLKHETVQGLHTYGIWNDYIREKLAPFPALYLYGFDLSPWPISHLRLADILIGNSRYWKVTLNECRFDEMVFLECDFSESHIYNCLIDRTRFLHCNLQAIDTVYSTFRECVFRDSPLGDFELTACCLMNCQGALKPSHYGGVQNQPL